MLVARKPKNFRLFINSEAIIQQSEDVYSNVKTKRWQACIKCDVFEDNISALPIVFFFCVLLLRFWLKNPV